jgi:hypothetical protein
VVVVLLVMAAGMQAGKQASRNEAQKPVSAVHAMILEHRWRAPYKIRLVWCVSIMQ